MKNNRAPEIRFPGYTGDWEKRKLGDIGSVVMCKRIFKEQTSENGEIPFFKIGTFGGIPDSFISRELFDEYKRKYPFPENGDVLISASGTIGRTVVYNGEEAYYQDSNIVWLQRDKEQVDNSFLQQFYQIVKWAGIEGSTIKRLYNSNILSTEILLPSIEEQTKISNFFKQLDDTIALCLQELTILKQTKQGFFQKMLPKEGESLPEVRFPGFTGDWEQIRLGDRATIKGRLGWKSLKQEEYTSDGPSMIAGKHIKNGVIDWNVVDHIPQWRYDESPEIMLKNGDVIFSKDGSLGNPALISGLNISATINSTMMLVRVDETIDPSFFYQVMKSEKFERLIYLKVSGSSIPHLFQADMNEFMFLAPEKEEQIKIGTFFKQLDDIIALHQCELDSLKETKKAFLQKVFA